jgi:hypothetical protein
MNSVKTKRKRKRVKITFSLINFFFKAIVKNNATEFVSDVDSIITFHNESDELFPKAFNLNVQAFNINLNFDFFQLKNPVNTSQVYLVTQNSKLTEQNFTNILVGLHLKLICLFYLIDIICH